MEPQQIICPCKNKMVSIVKHDWGEVFWCKDCGVLAEMSIEEEMLGDGNPNFRFPLSINVTINKD